MAGCALERGPIRTSFIDPSRTDAPAPIDVGPRDGGPDAGPVDVGPIDAGPDVGPTDAGPLDAGFDAGRDAGPRDAGPPDAGPPDAGPPDAGPPDAGPPDAGPADAGPRPLRSCNAIYGAVSGYQLCAERATQCEFVANTGGGSCTDLCTGVAAACVAAYADAWWSACTRDGTESCGDDRSREICVCTRIP